MTIHFLQSRDPPVVPSLQATELVEAFQAENGVQEWPVVDGYDTTFVDDVEWLRNYTKVGTALCGNQAHARCRLQAVGVQAVHGENKESLGDLLAGFFAYYATEFSHRTDVVDIAHSNEGKKKLKKNMFSRAKHWRMCIADPFETSRDLGA